MVLGLVVLGVGESPVSDPLVPATPLSATPLSSHTLTTHRRHRTIFCIPCRTLPATAIFYHDPLLTCAFLNRLSHMPSCPDTGIHGPCIQLLDTVDVQ